MFSYFQEKGITKTPINIFLLQTVGEFCGSIVVSSRNTEVLCDDTKNCC